MALGPVVRVEASPESPAEALASVETVAVLTGEEGERWHLLEVEWSWETSLIGVMAEPSREPFMRRVTGGPVFPGGEGMVYAALIGPRTGGRPPSLEAVHRMALGLLEGCDATPRLEARCGGAPVWAGVGKLAQRPLIELYGPRGVVEELASRSGRVVASVELDRSLVRRDSLERLESPEWNWGGVEGGTHRASMRTAWGFLLAAEARLEPPLVEDLRLYTDAFVYPPAQALLLVGQLRGIPPAPTAVLEFLNGWATLVEAVGVEYGELKGLLLGLFEEMARDAGLWQGPQ